VEGKRPLGRPICRWENNIKRDRREVGCGGIDWIHLAQDMDQWCALMDMVTKHWVSQNFGEFLNSRATVRFSRGAQVHGVWRLVGYGSRLRLSQHETYTSLLLGYRVCALVVPLIFKYM
jgi:hypothetical protein